MEADAKAHPEAQRMEPKWTCHLSGKKAADF